MNAVEKASRDILVALVIEANRQNSAVPELKDLKAQYNLKIADVLLDSSIDQWEMLDLLIVSRTFSGTGACIKPGKYGPALAELLRLLDATTFDVDWTKEEILTDAKIGDDFPSPNGWKLFQFDKSSPSSSVEPSNLTVQSSTWTGLPSNFELSEIQRQNLVRDLETAEEKLQSLSLSQEIQAQARAYIVAARILAEAPDPPIDVIWEIVNRANSLAGVAALFVSILGFFI